MRTCLRALAATWWRHEMETFSALLAICGENSPIPDEFPAQKPVTRSFGVFFDLHPNKRLSKQWWGWWFETQSCPLWRHRNVLCMWWIWFWVQGPSLICISQIHVHAFVQQWHPDNAYLGCIMLCEWFRFTQKALNIPFGKSNIFLVSKP